MLHEIAQLQQGRGPPPRRFTCLGQTRTLAPRRRPYVTAAVKSLLHTKRLMATLNRRRDTTVGCGWQHRSIAAGSTISAPLPAGRALREHGARGAAVAAASERRASRAAPARQAPRARPARRPCRRARRPRAWTDRSSPSPRAPACARGQRRGSRGAQRMLGERPQARRRPPAARRSSRPGCAVRSRESSASRRGCRAASAAPRSRGSRRLSIAAISRRALDSASAAARDQRVDTQARTRRGRGLPPAQAAPTGGRRARPAFQREMVTLNLAGVAALEDHDALAARSADGATAPSRRAASAERRAALVERSPQVAAVVALW